MFASQNGAAALGAFPWRKLLSGACAQRLQSYSAALQSYMAVVEEGGSEQEQAPRGAWVDLNQTFEWSRKIQDVAPAILRRASFYDLCKRRPVLLPELMLAMGWPTPVSDLAIDQPSRDALLQVSAVHWPFPASFFEDDRACRMMLGNSMHISALGAILAFALSFERST